MVRREQREVRILIYCYAQTRYRRIVISYILLPYIDCSDEVRLRAEKSHSTFHGTMAFVFAAGSPPTAAIPYLWGINLNYTDRSSYSYRE